MKHLNTLAIAMFAGTALMQAEGVQESAGVPAVTADATTPAAETKPTVAEVNAEKKAKKEAEKKAKEDAKAEAKAKKEAEAAAKKAEKAASKMPTQNGITRPGAGTGTGKVWDIADRLSAETQKPAERGAVIKAAEAEGVNISTASTQYGRWRQFHGLKAERITKAAADVAAKTEAPAAV